MIPWWWLLVALVVGALLVPAFYAIVGFLATGFSKNIGPGGMPRLLARPAVGGR